MTDDHGPVSAFRFGARVLAFVLLAGLAGGAVAGGVTAAAAAAGPPSRGAFGERYEWSPAGPGDHHYPDTPAAGLAFGVWRGARFGAAAGLAGLLVAGLPGPPRLRLRGDWPAVPMAAVGALAVAAAAAGVGAALGPHTVEERMGYVGYGKTRDVGESTRFMVAAVAREGLFWGGVGWSALAALWLRAAWRAGEPPA